MKDVIALESINTVTVLTDSITQAVSIVVQDSRIEQIKNAWCVSVESIFAKAAKYRHSAGQIIDRLFCVFIQCASGCSAGNRFAACIVIERSGALANVRRRAH